MANSKIKFIVKIDEGGFKVLKCEFKNKRWQIISRFSENSANISDNQTTERLKEIFKNLKLKNEPVIVALGRRLAVTRYISLPTIDKREIAEMIGFWMPRCLPYPLEELAGGWDLISNKDGYSRIMLSVVQRKELKRVSAIVPVKIEQIEAVFLDSCGFAASLTDNTPVVGVSIDDFSAQIVIAKDGKLLFSRAVSLDFGSVIAAKILAEEIDKSIKAYQRENIDIFPSKVMLYGKIIEGMQAQIESMQKIEVKVFLEQDAECLGVLGLKESTLNLATPDFLSQRDNKVAWVYFKKSLGLALVVLVLFILDAHLYIKSQKVYLKELEKSIESTLSKGRQLDEMYSVLSKLDPKNGQQSVSLDLISQLHALLPSSLTLETFSYQRNKEFILKGKADSLSSVLNAISILEKSGYFSGLKVNYASKSENVSGDSVGFQITGYLKSKKKS